MTLNHIVKVWPFLHTFFMRFSNKALHLKHDFVLLYYEIFCQNIGAPLHGFTIGVSQSPLPHKHNCFLAVNYEQFLSSPKTNITTLLTSL